MHTSRFSNVPEPSSRARRTVARCTCPMLAAARGSSENSTTSTFPPFSIKPFGARQSFPRCASTAPFSWLAGMTSAPSRTRSSARAIAGGTTDSSWMDSICPSFNAAPRMRHSATARRSALASVRKTLSPTSEGAGDSGDSEDSEDTFACANVLRIFRARSGLEFASFLLVVVTPAPRHARRADSATVPAARPTASWPNPITRAIGEDGTATSLRFVDILWFFCGYEPEMFSFAFASASSSGRRRHPRLWVVRALARGLRVPRLRHRVGNERYRLGARFHGVARCRRGRWRSTRLLGSLQSRRAGRGAPRDAFGEHHLRQRSHLLGRQGTSRRGGAQGHTERAARKLRQRGMAVRHSAWWLARRTRRGDSRRPRRHDDDAKCRRCGVVDGNSGNSWLSHFVCTIVFRESVCLRTTARYGS